MLVATPSAPERPLEIDSAIQSAMPMLTSSEASDEAEQHRAGRFVSRTRFP